MFIPNIFILGAAKSGTTSLHNFLNMYSDVCMANPKEPFFFESEYESGLDYYQKKYFSHYKGEKYIGDSRHRNLFLPFVPQRILEVNRDAKFIIILRNPIERTYSHWWHFYARGIEKKSFAKKIKEEIELYDKGIINNFFAKPEDYKNTLKSYGGASYTSYVLSSLYAEQIERYYNLFDKAQFFIIDFEDFKQKQNAVLKKLIKWLFADDRTVLDFNKDNVAKRNDLRGTLLFVNNIFSPVKKIIPNFIIDSAKNKLLDKPKMGSREKEMLLNFFAKPNEDLTKLTGFNTKKWEKI